MRSMRDWKQVDSFVFVAKACVHCAVRGTPHETENHEHNRTKGVELQEEGAKIGDMTALPSASLRGQTPFW